MKVKEEIKIISIKDKARYFLQKQKIAGFTLFLGFYHIKSFRYSNAVKAQYKRGIVATDNTVEPRVNVTAFSVSPP